MSPHIALCPSQFLCLALFFFLFPSHNLFFPYSLAPSFKSMLLWVLSIANPNCFCFYSNICCHGKSVLEAYLIVFNYIWRWKINTEHCDWSLFQLVAWGHTACHMLSTKKKLLGIRTIFQPHPVSVKEQIKELVAALSSICTGGWSGALTIKSVSRKQEHARAPQGVTVAV